jgi:hypothetical protein
MIIYPKNINDIIRLRYDLIRTYSPYQFKDELKQFVIDELDNIINGITDLTPLVNMQEKIHVGMNTDIPNEWILACKHSQRTRK